MIVKRNNQLDIALTLKVTLRPIAKDIALGIVARVDDFFERPL